MDFNNVSHYAKERMATLRGENTRIEPWSHFASDLRTRKLILARLQAFFKQEEKASRKVHRSRG